MLNDNWDFEFPQASSYSFQRSTSRPRGADIITRDPDQELAEALAALEQQEDDDNDDQETESTFTSHHSNKFHIYDVAGSFPPGLDDYILNCGGKGLVTKLGTHKRVEDMGDWTDDLKLLPSTLHHPLSHLNSISRADVLDDLLASDSVPRKSVHFSSEAPQRNFYTPNEDLAQKQQEVQHGSGVNGQEEEEEDDEDGGFDDLEFPDNMADLGIKPRSASTALSNVPLALRERLATAIEDEKEDFGKDLLVENPHAFMLRSMTPKKPLLTSRIPRPAGLLPQQPASGPSLKLRLQRGISTSQKRQGVTAAAGTAPEQGLRPSTTLGPPRRPLFVAAHKTPKLEHTYGNGSELDGLDLLPEWRRRSMSFWKRENKAPNGVDPQRPWRHNMARRKPDLIRPNERPLQKEYADMRYDAVRCRWQGNEESALSFITSANDKQAQTPARRRPALLSNKMRSSAPGKYTEMVVGSMVFDPIEMRWVKAVDDDEDNVLDRIEDLPPAKAGPNAANRPTASSTAPNVFCISPRVQNRMREQEETSFQCMWSWSLPNHTRKRQNKLSIANMLYNA